MACKGSGAKMVPEVNRRSPCVGKDDIAENGSGGGGWNGLFLRTLMESFPQRVLFKDRSSVFLSCNSLYARELGLSSGEMRGRNDRDFFPDELSSKYRLDDRRILKSGRAEHFVEKYLRDGQEQWISTYKVPVEDESGESVGIMGISTDVSERRFLERALVASEKRFRLLLNSAGEGIYGLDNEGRCTFCNPSCLRELGYEREDDLIGRNMHDVVHHSRADGEPYPKEECAISEGFRRGVGVHREDEVMWRADGRSFPAEYRSYPVVKEGVVIGAVVTFSDISERKTAEKELRRSLRQKELLLQELHHRMKNNLQVILSLLFLRGRNGQAGKSSDALSLIQNHVQSMLLVHEGIYQSPDLTRIDLADYLTNLIDSLTVMESGEEVKLHLRSEADGILVNIEQAISLGLMVNELIFNSLKHGFSGGAAGNVEVGLSRGESGRGVVLVRDDGRGLPQGFRLEDTSTLGLNLVLNLATQIGGTVRCDDGPGACFSVDFPLVEIEGR